MKSSRPQFELTRVLSDGTYSTPEIVPVTELPWDTKMNRRGFLGVGLTATAILGLLSGCDEKNLFSSQPAREIDILDSPDLRKLSPEKALQAHQQSIAQLIFSPDSASLYSSSLDKSVKYWSIPDAKLIGMVKDSVLNPGGIGITPDGKALVAELGVHVGIWEMPEGKLAKKIPLGESAFTKRFEFSPDGNSFAVALPDSVDLFSVPEGERKASIKGFEQKQLSLLEFTPNGQMLITGSLGDVIRCWSSADGSKVAELEESATWTPLEKMIAIGPESNLLAAIAPGKLEYWSLPEGVKNRTEIKDFDIRGFWLTPDGKSAITIGSHYSTPELPKSSEDFANYIPSSSTTTAIKLWTFPEMKEVTIGKIRSADGLSGAGLDTSNLVVTPDGKTVAASFYNGTEIWLLSLPDLTMQAVLKGTEKVIQTFAVSPDGKYLAAGDYGGTISLWDLEKREFLTYLFDKSANRSSVKGVAYNVTDKVTGRTITYTLPCGSPIPPGAICTCNCVSGTYSPPPPPRPRIPRQTGGWGTYCTCNKICTCIPVPSDREVKEAVEKTDPAEILKLLSGIPIYSWKYKWDDASVRHIGPMAQDFAKTFGVGDDEKVIHPVDAQGVSLSAIQGLYDYIKHLEDEVRELKELCIEKKNGLG